MRAASFGLAGREPLFEAALPRFLLDLPLERVELARP